MKYLEKEENIEQAEYRLEFFAKVNPDLIYYYLNYLNLVANDSIYNRDSNYYNILQYENSVSVRYNNEWVEKEIRYAENLAEPELVFNELESMLDEFWISDFETPNYTIELKHDKNLQKFFTYKCLSLDASLIYDEHMDYEKAVNYILEKYVARVKTEYISRKSDDNYIPEIQLENLLKHHLFSKGFSPSKSRNIDFRVSEYLLALLDYSEFIEYSGVILGFNIETFKYSLSSEEPTEPYFPYHQFTIEGITGTAIGYNITAGYRIKLNDFKSAFSHMDISLGWSFYTHNNIVESKTKTIDKYYFIWEGVPQNFVFLFNGTIKSASWEINKLSTISSNLNLPVFYFNQRLFVELGLQYKYLMAEYLVTVNRDILTQSAIDPTILGPELEVFTQKTQKHLFGGSISIGYSIINSLNIKGTFSTLPSVQIGLEYLFIL
jgi:hypothetical protein